MNIKSGGVTISVYEYKHDKVGNRTRMYQGGSTYTTYTYDKAYQLTKDQATGQTTGIQYAFDPAGNRSRMILDDGTRTSYTYDAANQLTRIAGPLSTLTYDPAGNPGPEKGPSLINRIRGVREASAVVFERCLTRDSVRLS